MGDIGEERRDSIDMLNLIGAPGPHLLESMLRIFQLEANLASRAESPFRYHRCRRSAIRGSETGLVEGIRSTCKAFLCERPAYCGILPAQVSILRPVAAKSIAKPR